MFIASSNVLFPQSNSDTSTIRTQRTGLDSTVTYTSRDSTVFSLKKRTFKDRMPTVALLLFVTDVCICKLEDTLLVPIPNFADKLSIYMSFVFKVVNLLSAPVYGDADKDPDDNDIPVLELS